MSTLTVETGLEIPMRDGVNLVTDLVRPAQSRSPAVIMRTAYDRTTAASKALQVDAMGLASAGYAVLVQDVRGRYASRGSFEPFVNEQADGVDTIEWAAAQTWCDGTVTMAGISYNAFSQLAAAVAEPEPLRAIVPGLGPGDIRTSWLRLGGVQNLGFHLSWLLGPLLPIDSRVPGPDPFLDAWDTPGASASAGLQSQVLEGSPAEPWIEEWEDTTPYAADSRVPDAGVLAGLAVPALVVAGWFDVFATGSLDLAAGAGAESRLVVGPWDHSGLPMGRWAGDADHGRTAEVSLSELQRRWYDLALRGEGEAGAAARVFVTGANEWADYDAWPPAAQPTTFWLSAGGGLGDTASAGSAAIEVDEDDPTPALGGQVYPWAPTLRSGSYDQRRREARSDVHSFTTEPLTESRRFVGRAAASLAVAGPLGAPVVLTVVDVHPDGSAWNVADGVAAVDAQAPTAVEMGYLGHEFRAGHRIRLDVSGAAWPRFPLMGGLRELSLAGCSLTVPEVSL